MNTTEQALELTTVNAEAIDDNDLESLYVSNSATGKSTLYRVSHPLKTYLLVADRGMGKTHILKLLRKKLKDNNNIVVDISSYSDLVEKTYYQLKKQYPEENHPEIGISQVWELAILEAACIKLLSSGFYSYKLSTMNSLLFDYFAHYQPSELNNSKQLWKDHFRTHPERGPLDEISISVETFWAKLGTVVKRNSAKRKDPPPVTFNDRYKLLSDWFWMTLKYFQSQNNFKFKKQSADGLPSVRSVYVIADGLDQGFDGGKGKKNFKRPIPQDDLNALIGALKNLDVLAADNLKGGERNFKMVLALRAITYATSVNHKDLAQMRGNIEDLSWDDESLKNMINQYIVQFSTKKTDDKGNTVLPKVFPENVFYFGKKFGAGIDFLIEYTERRPREILLLWQESTKAKGNKDDLYTTELTAQNLVDGLKEYSKNALPDDISNEYELEYPGIKELIDAIADNYRSIPRFVPKDQLGKIISDYFYKPPLSKNPTWFTSDKNNTFKILFQTGIIGLPHGDVVDENWPKAKYANEKTDYGVESAGFFVVRPAFWNYLTNIEVETKNRRKHIRTLYNELMSYTSRLEGLIKKAGSDPQNFQLALGSFFVLCDMIDNFRGYPEPLDWKIWNKVDEKIHLIYTKFVNARLCANRPGLDRMVKLFRKIIVKNNDGKEKADAIDFVDVSAFQKNVLENKEEYKSAMRSLLSWLEQQEKTEEIKQFRLCLIEGEDSLYSVLGEAKENVTDLL